MYSDGSPWRHGEGHWSLRAPGGICYCRRLRDAAARCYKNRCVHINRHSRSARTAWWSDTRAHYICNPRSLPRWSRSKASVRWIPSLGTVHDGRVRPGRVSPGTVPLVRPRVQVCTRDLLGSGADLPTGGHLPSRRATGRGPCGGTGRRGRASRTRLDLLLTLTGGQTPGACPSRTDRHREQDVPGTVYRLLHGPPVPRYPTDPAQVSVK